MIIITSIMTIVYVNNQMTGNLEIDVIRNEIDELDKKTCEIINFVWNEKINKCEPPLIQINDLDTTNNGITWKLIGKTLSFADPIDVVIKNLEGKTILTDQFFANTNGKFEYDITTEDPLWSKSKEYSIELKQRDFKIIRSFELDKSLINEKK